MTNIKQLTEEEKLAEAGRYIAYTSVIGATNKDAIAASIDDATLITLQNLYGAGYKVKALSLRFKTGLETAEIVDLRDTRFNRSLVSGNLFFSAVGQVHTGDYEPYLFILPIPIILQQGSTLNLRVKTKATAIAIGDVNLAVYGVQSDAYGQQ